ncbi:hypothetical protein MNV49_001673 [Pseudohyphozyma bogoriensis]|nr:hypothetical protein MNV49_001673 [Pseudohyphozyma bogoriensis]
MDDDVDPHTEHLNLKRALEGDDGLELEHIALDHPAEREALRQSLEAAAREAQRQSTAEHDEEHDDAVDQQEQDEDEQAIQQHLEQHINEFIRIPNEGFFSDAGVDDDNVNEFLNQLTASNTAGDVDLSGTGTGTGTGDDVDVHLAGDGQDGQPDEIELVDFEEYHHQPVDADEWDSTVLNGIESYDELEQRKEEVVKLLIEQGNVPGLQEESHAAIEASLEEKMPSWATLLRRCFLLYSQFCTQRGIPVFPIHPVKVGLYLARTDLDDTTDSSNQYQQSQPSNNHSVDDAVAAAVRAQDLDVSSASNIDPVLAGFDVNVSPTEQQNTKPAPLQAVGPKPKKVLRRKTLEQYVNRLTALRTPTLGMWKSRTGGGENEAGLGMAPVVRSILERAGGESAVDVKKRGRANKAKGLQPKPRTKAPVKKKLPTVQEQQQQQPQHPGDIDVMQDLQVLDHDSTLDHHLHQHHEMDDSIQPDIEALVQQSLASLPIDTSSIDQSVANALSHTFNLTSPSGHSFSLSSNSLGALPPSAAAAFLGLGAFTSPSDRTDGKTTGVGETYELSDSVFQQVFAHTPPSSSFQEAKAP